MYRMFLQGDEAMKANNTKKAAATALLMLVQLALCSFAPLASSLFTGYLKVLAVKLIYALSFVTPYFLWKHYFKPVGVNYSMHTWCEYKKPAFFIAFAAIVACLQLNIVLLELLPIKASPSAGMFDGILGFFFSLVMYAVIPALTEELFFRVVIMRVSGSGMRAAILSGVLFGLCHFNPSQLIYAVGSGVVLSLLCLYTNDVKLPVILHLCVNTTVLVLSYLAKLLPVGFYVALECIVWLTVLSLGIFGCYILLRDYGRQLNSRHEEIKKINTDITRTELCSAAMIIVYCAIIVATVLRLL